eukprot:362744-Chlamydomonas_euryale.AAC.6
MHGSARAVTWRRNEAWLGELPTASGGPSATRRSVVRDSIGASDHSADAPRRASCVAPSVAPLERKINSLSLRTRASSPSSGAAVAAAAAALTAAAEGRDGRSGCGGNVLRCRPR